MSTTTPMQPCLTKKDVAHRLNVSEKTVDRMIKDGDLIGFKTRGEWRMRPENLERWISSKEKQTA